MDLPAYRERMLSVMGLALTACASSSSPSPTVVVDAPKPDASTPGRFAQPPGRTLCQADTARRTSCRSIPNGQSCYDGKSGQKMERIGYSLDPEETEKRQDASGRSNVCCYSKCKPMAVRAEGVPIPEKQRGSMMSCVKAPEGGTKFPSSIDPDCPAALVVNGTARAHTSTKPSKVGKRCCYQLPTRNRQPDIGDEFRNRRVYYRGRPLQGPDGPVLSPRADRQDWTASAVPHQLGETLEPALRAEVASRWAAHAAFEHGSVAAFAKLTLDLMALGAPAELVAASQRAGLDEIRHAEMGYALASAYGGTPVGPGPLPMGALPAPSFARLVRDTFDGGCCGETVATALAREAASLASEPAVARALTIIASDEQRHAELGWRVLAWAVQASEEARRTLAELVRNEGESEARRRPDGGALAAHGLLSAELEGHIEAEVMRHVVHPCAAALLAKPPPRRAAESHLA